MSRLCLHALASLLLALASFSVTRADVGSPTATGGDFSALIGQRVLARQLGAKFLKNGNEVLAQPGKIYVVDRAEGNKVWVRGQAGWIDGQSIIKASTANDFFTNRLYKEPTLENYLSRAQSWAAQGNFDRALTDFDAAIKFDAKSAIAHNGRGNCMMQKQEFKSAIDSYTKAIESKSDFAGAYNNRGNAWRAVREYEKALADYDAATKLRPGVIPAIYGQGICYSALGRHDDAIRSFDKVVEIQPRHADALNECGLAWQRKGDFLKAIASFTASAEAKPNHFEALNNVAWLLANCKQKELRSPERSLEFAARACKATDYNNWYCLGTLAASYARNRKFDEALKAQHRALRMMPKAAAAADRKDYERRLQIYDAGRKAS